MAKFMYIIHETPNNSLGKGKLSPAEVEKVVEKFRAWSAKIAAAGKAVASEKLTEDGGRVISLQSGGLAVMDGPYSEAKEVVGGFFVVRAENYEEAVRLASDCPHVTLGIGRIEIRQTDKTGCGGE
jgi:hypothetical protein